MITIFLDCVPNLFLVKKTKKKKTGSLFTFLIGEKKQKHCWFQFDLIDIRDISLSINSSFTSVSFRLSFKMERERVKEKKCVCVCVNTNSLSSVSFLPVMFFGFHFLSVFTELNIVTCSVYFIRLLLEKMLIIV